MRVFFSTKFKLGSRKDKEKGANKNTISQLGPLPDWPPAPLIKTTSLRSTESSTTASSSTLTQPHFPALSTPASKPAELNAVPSTRTPVPQPLEPTPSGSGSNAMTNTTATVITVDTHKDATFISPSTTPTVEHPLRFPTPTNDLPPPRKKIPSNRSSKISTTGPPYSGSDLSPKPGEHFVVQATATSPYPNNVFADSASVQQAVRSGTTYSPSNSSSILSSASWSEHTEVDLVANVGSRERARQEFLFEIVSSEERYVIELAKMKETFIDPLLRPFSTASTYPQQSTPHPGTSSESFKDCYEDLPTIPSESLENLPTTSRLLASPVGGRSTTPAPPSTNHEETPHPEESDVDNDGYLAKGFSYKRAANHNHPRSPYNTTANRSCRNGEVPSPSRSHHSLHPSLRATDPADFTQSPGSQSFIADGLSTKETIQTQGTRESSKTHKNSISEPAPVPGVISPSQLPEDLRVCLVVIENDLLEGHVRLSEELKRRYEEQYPLVRSLADVFISSSHILRSCAKYMLHLEKALEQVDNAMNHATSAGRKPSRKQEGDKLLEIGTYLQRLEENAAMKGETGLAISLSKPFQRLLKYPLMFHNLLFHTDPSTLEYENTLQMIADVETIVRSIEDEKIQKEERDKTRDVLGRIDGLDKLKQLAVPNPSRVLVEERTVIQIGPSGSRMPPPGANGGRVNGKSSFKRLSDILQQGGNKDLWLVVFNDVVLRCQRTGITSLPIGGASYGRANPPEAESATPCRRNPHARPRNLYKFIKIEMWDVANVGKAREGVVAMSEVVPSRTRDLSVPPRTLPLPDDDEDEEAGDSDDSDLKSKRSFSFWGSDKITFQKPVTSKPRQIIPTQNGVHRGPTSAYASANVKFGTRLLSAESLVAPPRPSSRRTSAVTPVRRPLIDDTAVKPTVTRPTWNENPPSTSSPVPNRQSDPSKLNAVVTTRMPKNDSTTRLSSPSDDSGVGMYRQALANDASSAA